MLTLESELLHVSELLLTGQTTLVPRPSGFGEHGGGGISVRRLLSSRGRLLYREFLWNFDCIIWIRDRIGIYLNLEIHSKSKH